MGDVTLATALFDFEGMREDNLQFKAGDVITILEMNDNGWWKGFSRDGCVRSGLTVLVRGLARVLERPHETFS